MSDDKTNELLTEIRDLIAQREQQYKDHLAAVANAYAEQLRAGREYARRWAFIQWAALFFIVWGAVSLALANAK